MKPTEQILLQSTEPTQSDESNNSNYSRETIENSPFVKVNQENETWITVGKYKLRTYKTNEEAKKAIQEKDWNLIADLVSILFTYYKEETTNK